MQKEVYHRSWTQDIKLNEEFSESQVPSGTRDIWWKEIVAHGDYRVTVTTPNHCTSMF